MKHLILFSISFLILNHFQLFSQTAQPDSSTPVVDSTRVKWYTSNLNFDGKLHFQPLDTLLAGFQNYDLLTKSSYFHANLGNIGSASKSLFPYPFWEKSGFDYGNHHFDNYLFQNDSIRYYRVIKTYTELEYVQGSHKELNFYAKFSRNIYRTLNLGFDFHVSNAPGAYLRQKTNLINFVVTAQYFSRHNRYGVIANFLINRIKNQENGGIQNDSTFEQNLESNRELIAVNLQEAENRVKESGFYMKHYFNLYNPGVPDIDSSDHPRNWPDLGRLIFDFEYNRRIFNYTDIEADSLFYQNNNLIDSVSTRDSITIQRITCDLAWTNPSRNPQKPYRVLQIEGKISYRYSEVSDHYLRYFVNQVIPAAKLSLRPLKTMQLTAYLDYVFGTYNDGDVSGMVSLSQTLGSEKRNAGTISLLGHYKYQKPDWMFEHYAGNNFVWDTVWNKQGLISASAIYNWRFLTAGANLSRLSNYVYLDTNALPDQEQNEIGYFSLWLNTNLKLWKFMFNGQFAYQNVQNSNAIRVPAFTGNLTIYFTQSLFKGATVIQPGLNFFYNTSYYAESYMPATRSFYLQNTKEIGNYLYMDVFLNVKIQRARFFVTYTHFNASFMGRYYYSVPGYPMPDGAFKFGVSWRFHD